jgi:hypothetical protein
MSIAAVSGDWIGYYNYGDSGPHHNMELVLHFQDGIISGYGIDDVGKFSICGQIICESLNWIKSYKKHSVLYDGNFENNRVWGTWTTSLCEGGFLLWPRNGGKEGQSDNLESNPIADELPILAPFCRNRQRTP